MTISPANVDVGGASSPGGSKATNSVAFANNRLYVVTFSQRGGTNPDTTALTGGGITWAKVLTSRTSALMFMSQWWGLVTSGASTGALTATITGSPSSFKWIIDEFGSVNTTTPYLQPDPGGAGSWTTGSNSDPSISLSSFTDTTNN